MMFVPRSHVGEGRDVVANSWSPAGRGIQTRQKHVGPTYVTMTLWCPGAQRFEVEAVHASVMSAGFSSIGRRYER